MSHDHSPTPPTNISERIRFLRVKAGLTAVGLSELAGKSPHHVSVIEHRSSDSLDTATAAAYANVFGVTLDWLISGDGPEPILEDLLKAIEVAKQRMQAA